MVAKWLLVVFSAILFCSFLFSDTPASEHSNQITTVQAHEISGETPGNVSRTYIDGSGYEGRVFNEFTFHTIQEFHGIQSHVGLTQAKSTVRQFKAPIKVYKQIRKFLI